MQKQRRLRACSIIGIALLFLGVSGAVCQAQQYRIEITRAGFMNLGPDFQYDRGLRYAYKLEYPAAASHRSLWVLVDLDGKLSWSKHEASAESTSVTVDVSSRMSDGMSVGQHVLRLQVFDESSPAAPPGYPTGKASVPVGWVARATASATFTVWALEIPATRNDGIWLSSTPLGTEAYLAPAASVRRGDGGPDLSKVLDPKYYRGATPVFVAVPAGDYVVAFVLPVKEELRLALDDDFARVVTQKDGRVVSIGRGYEVTRDPGKLATVIGLFQLRDVPLAQAFLSLPPTPLYRFNADSLRTTLGKEGVAADVVDVLITILPRSGKVSVAAGRNLFVVEVTHDGWSITVFTLR